MSTLTEQPPDDAFVRTAIRGMRPPEHHPEFWDALAGQLDDAEDQMGVGGAFGPPGSLDSLDRLDRVPHERPRPRRPAARRSDHPPRRTPLRAVATPVDPADLPVPESAIAAVAPLEPDEPLTWTPAPAPALAPAPARAPAPAHVARQVLIDEPTAAVPAVAAVAHPPRQRAFVPAGSAATTAAALAGRGVRPVDPMAGLTIRHDEATMPGAMRSTSNVVLLALAVLAVAVAAVAGLSLVRRATDDDVSPPVPPAVEAGPAPTE